MPGAVARPEKGESQQVFLHGGGWVGVGGVKATVPPSPPPPGKSRGGRRQAEGGRARFAGHIGASFSRARRLLVSPNRRECRHHRDATSKPLRKFKPDGTPVGVFSCAQVNEYAERLLQVPPVVG